MSGETLATYAETHRRHATSFRKAFARYPDACNIWSGKPFLWHVDSLPEADDGVMVEGNAFPCVHIGQVTIAEGRYGCPTAVVLMRLTKDKAAKVVLMRAVRA